MTRVDLFAKLATALVAAPLASFAAAIATRAPGTLISGSAALAPLEEYATPFAPIEGTLSEDTFSDVATLIDHPTFVERSRLMDVGFTHYRVAGYQSIDPLGAR